MGRSESIGVARTSSHDATTISWVPGWPGRALRRTAIAQREASGVATPLSGRGGPGAAKLAHEPERLVDRGQLHYRPYYQRKRDYRDADGNGAHNTVDMAFAAGAKRPMRTLHRASPQDLLQNH